MINIFKFIVERRREKKHMQERLNIIKNMKYDLDTKEASDEKK